MCASSTATAAKTDMYGNCITSGDNVPSDTAQCTLVSSSLLVYCNYN